MAIIFSKNPLDWYATDGISVNEQSPPPGAKIVGTNEVKLVGEFPWGPTNSATKFDADNVNEFSQFLGEYSDPGSYGGVRAVVGKTFGVLNVVRIEADDAVKASRTLDDGVDNSYSITAKYSGVAGNEIEMKHTDNGDGTFDLAIQWGNYLQTYEGLTLGTLEDEVDDDYVDAVVDGAGGGIPSSDGAFVALTSGDDGTIADEEYIGGTGDIRGLRVHESGGDGGIVFIAEYTSSAVINAVASFITDKRAIGIVQGDADVTDLATAITAAQGETSDRLVVCLHGVKQTIDGTQYNVHLSAFAASILSQIPPHYSLADDDAGADYLGNIDDVVDGVVLGRSNWIDAENAGGVMLEARDAGGFKFHHPITASGGLVSNRRAKDIAGLSGAKALLPYQNKPGMPEFDEPAKQAVDNVLTAMEGTDGIPASKIIADHYVLLKEGAVPGADMYEVGVLLWGEKRFQVLTLIAGETVEIKDE